MGEKGAAEQRKTIAKHQIAPCLGPKGSGGGDLWDLLRTITTGAC